MAQIGNDIALAAKLLVDGELVAIPTETVYGLAANGLDADAVLKIYEVKNRPSFNPLILHLPDLQRAEQLVAEFPAKGRLLAEKFWPGPLTLVLKKKDIVPDIVSAGLDTVGIRIPRHPLTQQLLQSLDFPLAAPSANPSGYVSPTTPAHVQQQLGNEVAYILDGGECEVGIESTIIKVVGEEMTVLRLGGIAVELVEMALAKEAGRGEHLNQRLYSADKPDSPGMMTAHYAPKKKFVLGNIEENLKTFSGNKIGVLSFKNLGIRPQKIVRELVLSHSGDLHEAARNLFSYLRILDGSDLEVILAEAVPNEGLGRAINDRLKRAAAG